jgi:hypothetical protein
MMDYSPLRKAEYTALASLSLNGKVLDLGGDKRSGYNNLPKGDYTVTVLNFNSDTLPDIVHNLEITPLPIHSEEYDAVLLINVVEHIFNYKNLLTESHRVLKKNGKIVIAIPFLFPVHPSPNDFNRFTDAALKNILSECGFSNITVQPLGSGVFSVRTVFLHRLLPSPLRQLYGLIFFPLSSVCDGLLKMLAKVFDKKYNASDYAIGYFAVAEKI